MKKVLLLVALTLLALPSLALADHDDGGGRRHHHIGASEFAGAGAAVAAAIGLGGYLAIRKRSSYRN